MSALTPGLSSLLDTVIDRCDEDKARREAGTPAPAADPDQLTLFDVSEDGETFVAFDGQTL